MVRNPFQLGVFGVGPWEVYCARPLVKNQCRPCFTSAAGCRPALQDSGCCSLMCCDAVFWRRLAGFAGVRGSARCVLAHAMRACVTWYSAIRCGVTWYGMLRWGVTMACNFVLRHQGAVLVTLKSATKVPAADPNGLSDPYCILTLNKESKKSAVQLRTLDPVWEEKMDWTRVRGWAIATSLTRVLIFCVCCAESAHGVSRVGHHPGSHPKGSPMLDVAG